MIFDDYAERFINSKRSRSQYEMPGQEPKGEEGVAPTQPGVLPPRITR